MPEYLYRNDAGLEMSIFRRMNDERPEAVIVRADGWMPCSVTDEGPDIYRRVFAAGLQLNADPVTRRYPHISHTLPRDLKGEPCDDSGRVIVQNSDHEKRLAAAHGYELRD